MNRASFEYTDTVFGHNFVHFGNNQPCLLGIDEAGRGPVLGPMVYAVAISPVSKSSELKDAGVADSKTLTMSKRELIFSRMENQFDPLHSVVTFVVRPLSSRLISQCMLKRVKFGLNQLSHLTAIELIQIALDNKINVFEVFVDTVGPPESYQRKLESHFPLLRITVSKKADSLFPIVSAASIAAKVVRDRLLENWTFERGFDTDRRLCWGSGYPNDPVTKRFLVDAVDPVFGYPSLVRFSWKTTQNALRTTAAHCQWWW